MSGAGLGGAWRRAAVFGALIALALSARTSDAQGRAGLVIEPGTEVRLTLRAESQPVRARVVQLAGDTIVVRHDERIVRTALDDVRVLEVRGGEDKRRGVLIGAGVATAITAVFGGIDLHRGEITRDEFVGTMLGNALVGGLVGYAFAPAGWQRIPLGR